MSKEHAPRAAGPPGRPVLPPEAEQEIMERLFSDMKINSGGIAAILAEAGRAPRKLILKNLGKTFAPEGSVPQLEVRAGLDAASVAAAVREAVGR